MGKKPRNRLKDFIWIVVIPVTVGLVAGCAYSAYASPLEKPAVQAKAAGSQTSGSQTSGSQAPDPQTSRPQALSRCVLVIDAADGAQLRQDGDCATRRAPESTFKIPLALIGFETGILEGPHAPLWRYDGAFPAPARDHKDVDPVIWERDSVVWFSQALTTRLAQKDGEAALGEWVTRLDYGNQDVSGDPGQNNGLTQAWLSSSLKISPAEQTVFLRRLLHDDLPASARAMRLTRDVIPEFDAAGGWKVHGKTGSSKIASTARGWLAHGWFAGWAHKDGRTVIFAVFEQQLNDAAGQYVGPVLRERVLRNLGSYVE